MTGAWHLPSVVDNWNKNSKNILLPEGKEECHVTVTFFLRDKLSSEGEEDWGLTTGLKTPWVYVELNTHTPQEYYQHVLCHELGHALGLDHHSGRSCMNPDAVYPVPDQSDLENIVKGVAYLVR